MPLSQMATETLIQLESARLEAEESGNPGAAWRELPGDSHSYGQLVRYEYVEKRGNLYRITDDGRSLLAGTGVRESQTNIIPVMAGSEIPPPSAIVAPEASCTGKCENCIYRQALEIIAARMPEAAELTLVLNKLNVRLS